MSRIILASTQKNAWILDPFAGSCTTGIAAKLLKRNFVGVEINKQFLEICKCRNLEIESPAIRNEFIKKITGF